MIQELEDIPPSDRDLLDPRLRHAAAVLLTCVRLPAPVSQFADQVIEASRVDPSLKAEILTLSVEDRLRQVRASIDELLSEARS